MALSEDNFVQLIENGLVPLEGNQKSENSSNIHSRMKELHISGLSIVILQDFEIRHHLYYGKADIPLNKNVQKNSIFHACSISKMISSLAILKLVERGVLKLDSPISGYLTDWIFPENKFTKEKQVTIRHLLSHQAGIIDPEGSFEIYNSKTPFPHLGSACIVMMNTEPGKSQRESIIGEIYRGIGKALKWKGFS